MSLPLLVALAYDEKPEAWAFLMCIIGCIAAGNIINKVYKRDLGQETIERRDSYIIVSSAWLIASLIGCLPYLLTGVIDNFFLAFFETCSGFTTTGASVFTDIEHLPHAISFVALTGPVSDGRGTCASRPRTDSTSRSSR